MFLQSLGASGQIIGLVGGLRESISSILKVVCGYWSDKTGRRKVFVYAGYATSTVFKLLLAFSRIWHSAVAFSSLERIGKGLRTAARDAIIAESMTKQRGKAFGVHRAVETGGAILGAVVALLLFWFFGMKFGSIIFVAAVAGVASLIPLYFVRETGSVPRQNVALKLNIGTLSAPLRLFIVIAGIFALGEFSYMFFVMRVQQFFGGRLSVAAPILLYVLFNIFYSALAVPFGIISDKIGREKVIMLGYLMFSVTSVGFIFAHSLWVFVVLFAIYGVMFAAIDGNQRAFISDLAGVNLKATALGTFHTVTGFAALPAGLIAGFLWENISPNATFIYGGVLSLTAVGLFVVFKGRFGRS
jgi:MFS family permease